MAVPKYSTVGEFMADLAPARQELVNRVRTMILDVDPGLEEGMKWNAPNYSLGGFDRLTFNTMNRAKTLNLILHMGTSRKENKKGAPVLAVDRGIVVWSSDIRGVVDLESLDL